MYLARSANKFNVQQTYQEHVYGVLNFLDVFLKELKPYIKSQFAYILKKAAIYHDLGKLDLLNQEVLQNPNGKPLPTFHEDAGAAYCFQHDSIIQGILIYCHHRGLVNFADEFVKGDNAFRCFTNNGKLGNEHTDKNLDYYIKTHDKLVKLLSHSIRVCRLKISTKIKEEGLQKLGFFDWKLLLSLLVDSDHSDSARHANFVTSHTNTPTESCLEYKQPEARWAERIQKLDQKIELKSKAKTHNEQEAYRNKLRTEMYNCCKNSNISANIVQCEAPVGSGKTSAVLAYVLRKAKKCNYQRIFIVVPFISLIEQIISDIRDWIVLEGEDENEIVVGHYNTSIYESEKLKDLTTTWKARIVVTTSVQFFETLAATKTSKLRKLHNLAGSCILIDEFNSNLPLHLWPVSWKWAHKIATDFDCHFVISSGSMIKVWNIDGDENVPSILTKSQDKLFALERNRIQYKTHKRPFGVDELTNFVLNTGEYPKVIVLNTIHNAAILANELKKHIKVLYLSTHLTPNHRKEVIQKIFTGYKENWVLVATSCIESGMNFSFKTGFREAFSIPSVLQLGGRIDRDMVWGDCAVHLFKTTSNKFNKHPNSSDDFVLRAFDEYNQSQSMRVCGLQQLMDVYLEFEKRNLDFAFINKMQQYYENFNFKDISDNFKVIPNKMETVLINDALVAQLKNCDRINWRELKKYSVQITAGKLETFPLPKINRYDITYMEESLYDPIIGASKYFINTEDHLIV